MAGKLILTVAVPGAGKSTWANAQKAQDPENVVIVERDATRSTLFGDSYHKGHPQKSAEEKVTQVNTELIKQGLREGKTVIVSDTNLNPRFLPAVIKIGKDYGAEVSFQHFDVDPKECIRRNNARGKAGDRLVPYPIMTRMIEQAYGEDGHLKEMKLGSNGQVFFVPKTTPGSNLIEAFNKKAEFDNPMPDGAILLVDVDGTLANNHHDAARFLRPPAGEKKDFPAFFRGIQKAPVNKQVRDLANRMRDEEGISIFVLTGRSDSHSQELLDFIKRSGIKASKVIAKREGDFRPDSDFKDEILNELDKEGYSIVHALDDRASSVRTLESRGILVSRVEVPTFPAGADLSIPAPEPTLNTIYGSGYCIRCGQPLKNGGNLGPKCRLK
jgi:predicted kinase/sulfur carrier protein ThiS